MNPCVKTGIVFDFQGQRLTGDLFWEPETNWYVRGIPVECLDPAYQDVRKPHARIESKLEFVRDQNRPRYALLFGVRLIAVSQGFREQIDEWYPHLIDALPDEVMA